MGTQDSCRSFVLDTIINLSSFQGNHVWNVKNSSPVYMTRTTRLGSLFGPYPTVIMRSWKLLSFNAGESNFRTNSYREKTRYLLILWLCYARALFWWEPHFSMQIKKYLFFGVKINAKVGNWEISCPKLHSNFFKVKREFTILDKLAILKICSVLAPFIIFTVKKTRL